jgi:hypothetical protein
VKVAVTAAPSEGMLNKAAARRVMRDFMGGVVYL